MKNAKLYLITIVCLTLCWALIPINQATAGTITETFSGSSASYSKSITIPNLKSATATVTSAYGGNPTVNLLRNGDNLTMQVSGGSPNSTWNPGGCNYYTKTKTTTMNGTEAVTLRFNGWNEFICGVGAIENNLPSLIPYNEDNCSGELSKTDITPTGDWYDGGTGNSSDQTCKYETCQMSTGRTYTGYKYYYFTYSNFELVRQSTSPPSIPSYINFNEGGWSGTFRLSETSEGDEIFYGEGSDCYINGKLCQVVITSYDVYATYSGVATKQECRYDYYVYRYRDCVATYSGNIQCESCWDGWYDYYYSYTVTITYSDNTEPTISTTFPSKTIYSNKAGHDHVNITGLVKDVDVGDTLTIYYRLDNNSKIAMSSNIIANNTNQSFNGSIPIGSFNNGKHTLYVWAEDNMGGKSVETSTTISIDKIAPTVSAPLITVDSATQITVQANATDVVTNGVAAGLHATPYQYNRNGIDVGSWQNGNLVDNNLVPNTQYSYKAKARDAVDNLSDYSVVTTKYTLAKNPTAITCTGATVNSLTFNITNATGQGVKPSNRIEVKLKNAGLNGNTVSASDYDTNETNRTVTGLTPNTHYEVWVITKNGDGVANEPVKMIPDIATNSPPTITANSLTTQIFSNITGYNSIAVSGTLKDTDVGDIVKVFYRIDGTFGDLGTQIGNSITANATNQAWNGSINTSAISGGEHTLYIWAEDNKGGKSAEKSMYIQIDNKPPIVLEPIITVDSISQITIMSTANDDTIDGFAAGLHATPYQFIRDGISISTQQQECLFVDKNLTPNKKYTYVIKAQDNVGNIGASKAISKYTFAENPIGIEFVNYDAKTKNAIFKIVHTPQGEMPQTRIRLVGQSIIESDWSTNEQITVSNIDAGKTYQILAQVRNGDGVENELVQLMTDFNVGLPVLESVTLSNGMHNKSNPLKVVVQTRVSNIKTESDRQIKVYYTISGLAGHSNQQMQPLNNNLYNYIHTDEFGQYEGIVNFDGTEKQGIYKIKVWVTNGTGFRNVISEDKVELFTIGEDITDPGTFIPGQKDKDEGDVIPPSGQKADEYDFVNLNGKIINYNGEDVIAVQEKTITFAINELQNVWGIRYTLVGADIHDGAWENFFEDKNSLTKTISFASEGLNVLQFQFKDKYGNHSVWYKQKYLVDWTHPSLNLRNPYSATIAKNNGTYEVEIDAKDNISNKLYYKIENIRNVASKEFSKTQYIEIDKNNLIILEAIGSGVCTANVYVVDEVGNVTKQSIRFFNQ